MLICANVTAIICHRLESVTARQHHVAITSRLLITVAGFSRGRFGRRGLSQAFETQLADMSVRRHRATVEVTGLISPPPSNGAHFELMI